jgi:hypothetical protein
VVIGNKDGFDRYRTDGAGDQALVARRVFSFRPERAGSKISTSPEWQDDIAGISAYRMFPS